MANWDEISEEVDELARTTKNPFNEVRRIHLNRFAEKTGRNALAYYSGWLQKNGPGFGSFVSITDEDKNGLMACFRNMKFENGLDIFIHSPGGNVAATDSLIHYIRSKFGSNVRVFVPQLSMSGGTMIAFAGKEIWMGLHSNLGPIDPQFGSQPAQLVLDEFDDISKKIASAPELIHVYRPILEQIRPTFLSTCRHAIDWSKEIGKKSLMRGMFEGHDDAEEKADKIVNYFSDATQHKHHSRHIHREECEEVGLKIMNFESDQEMQDLALGVHHAFVFTLMNTPIAKIIENQNGIFQAKAIGDHPLSSNER
ncbi:MAG: S49 family peptidase [Alphaproteobacteria bacterium]|nr:S49 family peptidase [Alphaproteobacteria bacterium]